MSEDIVYILKWLHLKTFFYFFLDFCFNFILFILISTLINEIDDTINHILFFTIRIQNIIFWKAFVRLWVTPHLYLTILTNMKHVLENIKIAKLLKQYFKTFQSYRKKMETIIEGNVFDLTQIGSRGFVIDISMILFATAFDPCLLTG